MQNVAPSVQLPYKSYMKKFLKIAMNNARNAAGEQLEQDRDIVWEFNRKTS